MTDWIGAHWAAMSRYPSEFITFGLIVAIATAGMMAFLYRHSREVAADSVALAKDKLAVQAEKLEQLGAENAALRERLRAAEEPHRAGLGATSGHLDPEAFEVLKMLGALENTSLAVTPWRLTFTTKGTLNLSHQKATFLLADLVERGFAVVIREFEPGYPNTAISHAGRAYLHSRGALP